MREEEPAAVITAEKTARAFSPCEKEVNGVPALEYFNTPRDFWQAPIRSGFADTDQM
jgi:hypothetical protein